MYSIDLGHERVPVSLPFGLCVYHSFVLGLGPTAEVLTELFLSYVAAGSPQSPASRMGLGLRKLVNDLETRTIKPLHTDYKKEAMLRIPAKKVKGLHLGAIGTLLDCSPRISLSLYSTWACFRSLVRATPGLLLRSLYKSTIIQKLYDLLYIPIMVHQIKVPDMIALIPKIMAVSATSLGTLEVHVE